MTKEQAKKEFWQVSRDGYSGVFERAFNIKFNEVIKMPYHGSEFDKFIDKIYDYFEQHIKELVSDNKELSKDFTHSKYVDKYKELEAPNTCEGCKWYVPEDTYHNYCDNVNSHICVRYSFNDVEDYYEPKDSK